MAHDRACTASFCHGPDQEAKGGKGTDESFDGEQVANGVRMHVDKRELANPEDEEGQHTKRINGI